MTLISVIVHLQHDWLPLVGQHIEIRLDGRKIRDGWVDDVTHDGSILWLAADGPHLRAMVERADGYEVWIRYKWETPGIGSQNSGYNGTNEIGNP